MGTGIIILAAGNSSRLGYPKQLVKFQGESLLGNTIKMALELDIGPVIVVEGAYTFNLPVVSGLHTIRNSEWKNGMGSSIKLGLASLEKLAAIDQVFILLSDQPLISTTHLKTILDKKKETTLPMIASFYKNSPGVPALFDKSCFSSLLSLEDKQGAKKLFHAHRDLLGVVSLEVAKIDIDTPDDLRALNNSNWGHFD
ncbi:nucleotidyltransferase family protein [Cyclobacterium jeungdonense]|uniref:Nucleotidyltransferase family protein n=1 Tax=Cyclobacterium jeungdonense TaxID=708087 RepID=A0ABT8C3R2_9BACT|nr:nucleotidyltransferase family protein [Cyclobacterium jeungdonense]MDN3686400.1 nucleotidyltransferase family protein [Cyclobacterium jeungdonense]